MKKADQVSGATIDVPDRAPPLGQFPYHGFWQQIYKQLPSAIETKTGFTKYDIAAALTEIENLANGPYKVIVGEKLWKIGALLSMNQYIPASGRGGTTLDYITESNDGGRVEIAAVCMEPMLNAILQRASMSGKIGQELGELESEYEEKMELMRTVGARMNELEQWTPLHSLDAARTEYDAVKRDLAVKQTEIASISTGIEMTDQLNAEIRSVSTQLSKAERDHKTVLQQIHHWQTKLRNGQNTNNGNTVTNATARLSELNKANQALSQSITGLGQKLMSLQTKDTDSSGMKRSRTAMQKDASQLIKQLSSIQKAYATQEQTYANIEGEMIGIQKAGSRLSADIERLAKKISKLKNSQSDVVASNESEMVRLWVNHLSGVYWDAESYLFNNLRIAQEAAIGAQGSSIYMQKAVNASRIAEMEEFLTSIDTVTDHLDSDEVKVLEQIARLGTLMNYLPGTSRIMALRDMSYRQRKDAYKNMIDEMLEFGVRDPHGTRESPLKIGPLQIGKSEPLNEVADLLEHLADTLME